MGFFSKLFGGSAEPEANETPVMQVTQVLPSAGGGIAYDPELIANLKRDHQSIFRAYGDLQQAYAMGNFSGIPELLATFKLALQAHLMVENVKFYVYVQQHLPPEAEVAGFVTDVRREMEKIARATIRFVNTYAESSFASRETRAQFKEELDSIGAVLTKRVEMEEARLYTLYLPHY